MPEGLTATTASVAMVPNNMPDTNLHDSHGRITALLFLVALTLLVTAFRLSRSAQDAARQRDLMREQLRQLQMESIDLARSADEHRTAEEAKRKEVAVLEEKVAGLTRQSLPGAVEALNRRQRQRLELLRPTVTDVRNGEVAMG